MPHRSSLPYFTAVVLLLSACASAPAPTPSPTPAPPPPPVVAPPPPPVAAPPPAPAPDSRKISLLCGDKARTAFFDQLGVPSGERPIDVAINDRYIWVLFEPSRLLRLDRHGEKLEVEMTVGHADEHWSAFALDPKDDSIWVTSDQKLAFLHLSGAGRTVVPLKKVVGEGGFRQLLVTEDALYVRPTVAEKLVWRIDRTGKVLDTAFSAKPPAPSGLGGADVHEMNQPFQIGLFEDAEGYVLVRVETTGKILQADGKGGWTERTDLHWFDHVGRGGATVKGLAVGSQDERWFLAGGVRDLFFWKGRPVLLGPTAGGARFVKGEPMVGTQVFYLPDATGGKAGLRELFEDCRGGFLHKVAADATGYAAITERAVFFGDFANAPDLP